MALFKTAPITTDPLEILKYFSDMKASKGDKKRDGIMADSGFVGEETDTASLDWLASTFDKFREAKDNAKIDLETRRTSEENLALRDKLGITQSRDKPYGGSEDLDKLRMQMNDLGIAKRNDQPAQPEIEEVAMPEEVKPKLTSSILLEMLKKETKTNGTKENVDAISNASDDPYDESTFGEATAPVGGTEVSTGEGLMSRGPEFSPIKESIKEKTNNFYLDIGKKAETDHGSTPVPTNDKREKSLPTDEKSKDVGFGHKVKASENASGKIHGIKFKEDDGTYIELSQDQKTEILYRDMEAELSLARTKGWDSKLKKINTSWDELDYKYKNALTSLAFNTGGEKAGKQWTAVLKAAKDENPVEFAKQMRRKDSGLNSEGMDNRVAKELYYAGIIDNLSEVSSVLPLAKAARSGIPS